MHVAVKLKSLLLRESSEGDVTRYFMLLSESERAMGHYIAVIFDGQHCVVEAVSFNQVAGNEVLVWVLLFCVVEWISFFFLLLFFNFFFLDFLGNLMMNKVRLTLESARKLVVHIAMLRVDLRECHEFKIVGCCVIETLSWELVLAVVCCVR